MEDLLLLKMTPWSSPTHASLTYHQLDACTPWTEPRRDQMRRSEAFRAVGSIFFVCTETFAIHLVVVITTLCSYTLHSLVTLRSTQLHYPLA
jgi:hypothetical protein